jgi:predicted RNA-binding protein YlqC (UPF0109 family)
MREMNVSRHLDGAIASFIGQWYFYKKVGGSLDTRVKETRDEIVLLDIHGIHFDGEHIEIKLGRPGHLIGRRGENINALTVALRKEFEFKELRIVEERVVGRLFDFQLAYLTCDDSDCW